LDGTGGEGDLGGGGEEVGGRGCPSFRGVRKLCTAGPDVSHDVKAVPKQATSRATAKKMCVVEVRGTQLCKTGKAGQTFLEEDDAWRKSKPGQPSVDGSGGEGDLYG
jgi:hypothetical protein